MDHKDLCEHTRIRLIAAAIGHQQCTKTAASLTPLPGTECVIAIGTRADVARLLEAAPTIPAQAPAEEVRAKALEEAAQACAAERVENTGLDSDIAYNMATAHCAKAIRALAHQSTANSGDSSDLGKGADHA